MKPFKVTNNYVFVVYEYPHKKKEGRIHGLYINEEEAWGKYNKLDLLDTGTVLKKPLYGKSRVCSRLDLGDKRTYIQVRE